LVCSAAAASAGGVQPSEVAEPRLPVCASALNPKSLDLKELYGCYNPATNEWQDGLASSIVRAAASAEDGGAAGGGCPARSCQDWVVFDGPVDALWVESLNTGGLMRRLHALAMLCWRSAGLLWWLVRGSDLDTCQTLLRPASELAQPSSRSLPVKTTSANPPPPSFGRQRPVLPAEWRAHPPRPCARAAAI
jgi:hypothetical protein